MRIYSQFLILVVVSSTCLGLASCNGQPSSTESDRTVSSSPTATAPASPSSSPSPSPTAPTAQPQSPSKSQSLTRPASQTRTTTAATTQTTNATIYQVDNQCEDFVSKPVALPTVEPMEAAVKQVLATWDTADFSLAGYRVTVDATSRTATVDLRVDPNSKRRLTSLSSCEQLALFGALRKTLTANRQWNIDTVRFTEQGEEVVL